MDDSPRPPETALAAAEQCIQYSLDWYKDAPWEIYAAEQEAADLLRQAIGQGAPLSGNLQEHLGGLLRSYIHHLAYQRVREGGGPTLPLLELPGRLRCASAVLRLLRPLLEGQHEALSDSEAAIAAARR